MAQKPSPSTARNKLKMVGAQVLEIGIAQSPRSSLAEIRLLLVGLATSCALNGTDFARCMTAVVT